MLFESLDKLKRNTILSAIICMALGAVILICPKQHIPALTVLAGYTIIITSIVLMLEFMTSKRSLMDYLKFTAALIFGLIGLSVLVFQKDIVRVLAWLFGFLLICDGGRSMYHSLTFVRRANHRWWKVLVVLSALLIILGIIIFANPWWNTPIMLVKVIGGSILFAAAISICRLVLTWPLRDDDGGEEDE